MPQIISKAVDLLKTAKSGEPISDLHRSVPAEELWPAALQKEADQAASILRSFFIDGLIIPYRTLGKCPQQVLKNCCGIAVLHVLRAGLHSPSASGSGVIVARTNAGKWSGASAILVDYDLPQDVDVADIVIVLNDEAQLSAVSGSNAMLGKALRIEPGPIPPSDTPTGQIHNIGQKTDVAFSYAKSKGKLLELDLKSMVIRAADTENERFYGVSGIAASEILSGQLGTPSGVSNLLQNTLNALDQQSLHLSGLPESGNCPGDCRVKAPATAQA